MFPFSFTFPASPNPFEIDATTSVSDFGELHMPGGLYSDRSSPASSTNSRKRSRPEVVIPTIAVRQATLDSAWDYPETPASAAMAVDNSLDLDPFTTTTVSGHRARDEHEDEDEIDGPPPAKRRRTIADSVIDTALSAALIGAAVGVAAYRIWSNRGKPTNPASPNAPDVQQAPPPPYHPGDWGLHPNTSASSQTTPRRPRRPKSHAHTVGHNAGRRKMVAVTLPSPRTPPPPSLRSPTRDRILHSPVSEPADDATEFDEHADWMGSQLSRLIQEGKRALGRDIVLPTDPDALEIDEDVMQDDMGWVDEDRRRQRSISVSISHRRSRSSLGAPRSPNLSSSWSANSGSAMQGAALLRASTGSAPRRDDNDDVFLSPELREAMARARAARGL